MNIVLAVAFVVCVIASYVVIAFLMHEGRMERRELEDRVMSVQSPVALLTHAGLRDSSPAEVSYIDEAREAELSPSGGWQTYEEE